MPAKTIAIIGTGLIGASIGLALRRRSKKLRIVGWDRQPHALRIAKRRGAITKAAASFKLAISAADIVVLAAPAGAIPNLLKRAVRCAPAKSVIIDVAGSKSRIVRTASKLLGARTSPSFVAGHPMAGSESSGPEHASAGLFNARPFALYAPPQQNAERALRRASDFVRWLGAQPVIVAPGQHDRVVAATSGLPQFVSVALALAAADGAGREVAKLAGPGLTDATRLAAAPYRLWRDQVRENRPNLLRALAQFERNLHKIVTALARGDDRFLGRSFARAASVRRRVLGLPGRTGRRH